jgi:hypothetical protein
MESLQVAVKSILQGLDESQINDAVPIDTNQGIPCHGPNDGLQVLAGLDPHNCRALAGRRGEQGAQDQGENFREGSAAGLHDNCDLAFTSAPREQKPHGAETVVSRRRNSKDGKWGVKAEALKC